MAPARCFAALIALSFVASVACIAAEAKAAPQVNGGLTVGFAGVGDRRALWDTTVFHLGLRGDLQLGRSQPGDFSIGPYAEVFTHAFNEIQFGGGISTLVPIFDPFPAVVSLGAFGRKGDD